MRKLLIRGAAILLLLYVGLVTAFEAWLGYTQPTSEGTIVITTFQDGVGTDRVVARILTDGQLYVAANHWPRAWYRATLAEPDVRVSMDGVTADYLAVPVQGAEHDRVEASRPLSLFFRFLTGFPPRYFVRLDAKA